MRTDDWQTTWEEKEKKQDNFWIVMPWNMTPTIDQGGVPRSAKNTLKPHSVPGLSI
jgi:hypothetical protein